MKYLVNYNDFINEDKTNKLLAPNDKPSNLSPKLYKLVRTPEFKNWFGDWENDPKHASKVLDINGEPAIMHHVGMFNFDERGLLGNAWFTINKADAKYYAKQTGGRVTSAFIKIINPLYAADKNKYIETNNAVLIALKKGKDGVIDVESKDTVSFEPEQIKSADGTNTTFDSKNPNIRK
jgi:hypothetical protein